MHQIRFQLGEGRLPPGTWPQVNTGNSYQHGGSDVELLLVLSNKDVCLHDVLQVMFLDVTKYVGQPLELTLGPRHPHEVDLTHNTLQPFNVTLQHGSTPNSYCP